MTSVISNISEKPTAIDATAPAVALRPVSSARRQLPVPQVSSRISPPKALLPQKSSEINSENGGVMVQVEMERQVKVEMVKQVKVNCTIQENCDSQSAALIPHPNDSKTSSVASTLDSLCSPSNKTSSRQLNPPSKVGVSAAKPAVVPPGVVPPSSRSTDKSEAERRGGAVSAPPIGVQYTIRKGIPRQLPNTDLVKKTNQKDSAEGRSPRRSPMVASDSPLLRRPTVFNNKSSENKRSTETGKSAAETSTVVSKSASGSVASASAKVVKATASIDSSPSSSASSSAVTHAFLKRPLRYNQHPVNSSPKPDCKPFVRSSPGKTKVGSNSLSEEAKSRIPNRNRKPEKSAHFLVKSSKKPNAVESGLKSLRNVLPLKKHGLLSVVGKDSSSSSRRTSNSSISCASRSESAAKSSSLIQGGQPSDNQDTDSIKHGDAEQMMIMQYIHQPDIVSNAVQREVPIKKFQMLEMQCEKIGKHLNVSMSELKSRTTALEATSVVVKHLSEQVEFLSETITHLRSELLSNDAKCEMLAHQRNALISEIQGLKEDHEVQVNGMTVIHQMELHSFQEKIKSLVEEVEERHLQLMASVQSESKLAMDELKTQNVKDMDAKDSEFVNQLADGELKQKQKITDLQRSQEGRLKELKTQFEAIKCALVEKIDHLTSECSDLRRQNQILVDGNPSASTDFGNSEAEKQVETLTQEIESLKVVLELRNQEIGRLRSQNVTRETQLQELTEAKQKIHQLQRKLENTEAIIHMKSDYERELAEKHTTLLRRYSKESKVNKRLSMNNEELMWKLEQVAAPAKSPKPIRRTHSGPPAKSAPGTPLVVRRSQPDMNWESFSSEPGVLPGEEDSDQDSVLE